MQRAFGQRTRSLRRRLRALSQASNLADVPTDPPERRHQLTGDRKGQLAVMLTGNWRLIFEPDHDPVPLKDDGGLDLEQVTAIKFIEIVDYHGS